LAQLIIQDVPVACPACGDPVDVGENFCGICGEDLRHLQGDQEPEEQRHTCSCQTCGATLSVEGSRAITCPFCKSSQVVNQPELAHYPDPEFIVGFANVEEEAQRKFKAWIRKGGITVPGDLARAATLDELRGVYVPFWGFSVRADSRYTCRIGEYWYRTETYTTIVNGKVVTRTRRVRETEWFSLNGQHHSYHNRYLVSGSKGLSQELADAVMPYDLAHIHRFKESFLAGWLMEEPSVKMEDAYEVSNQRFYEAERERIAKVLPGDTHSSLQVETNFSQATSDLILLPTWLLSYDYKGKRYNFVMNGQTGAMSGTRPKVYWKIVLLVVTLLAIVLGCVGLISLIALIAGNL